MPTLAMNQSVRNGTRLSSIIAALNKTIAYLNATTLREFTQYGSYSIVNLTRTNINTKTLGKVMLLSINTQACYSYNLALMLERNDTGGLLQWIEAKLSWAESKGLLVFIMGHVPPGNTQCNRQWEERYNALIERYQHIVRLQVFGHEGTDSFKLLRSYEDEAVYGTL